MQNNETTDSTVLLADVSCRRFSLLLSSGEPVPGGGGAAALAGALGAALCSMVGNLTLGKKKYADVEQDVREMIDKSGDICARQLELIDEDARAFLPLQKAYSVPKDDPARAQTLQSASLSACEAPLAMMTQCAQTIELLEEMLEKGSAMMVSDVGCAAALCRSALIAASMNVYINTKAQSCEVAVQIEQKADELLREYTARAEDISNEVLKRIRRE